MISRKTTEGIVIHHSGSEQPLSFKACVKLHKKRRFKTIGYHIYIERDGSVHYGRPLGVVGAHSKGNRNCTHVGICLDGHFGLYMPTGAQMESLKEEMKKLDTIFNFGIYEGNWYDVVDYHHEECPGKYFRLLFEE